MLTPAQAQIEDLCPRGPSLSLESKGQSGGGQTLFAARGNSGT